MFLGELPSKDSINYILGLIHWTCSGSTLARNRFGPYLERRGQSPAMLVPPWLGWNKSLESHIMQRADFGHTSS